jgi:hypothetical protein
MVPPLYAGIVDDASVLPPGEAGLAAALTAFERHRDAWYAPMIGCFLVPSSVVDFDRAWPAQPLGLVNDTALTALPAAVAKLRASGAEVRQVEAAVARRGEDMQPGLGELVRFAGETSDLTVYAEIPLSWGLLAALDRVAEARGSGLPIAPKFRVGGLAAELYPTPVELAAVICACRDRNLPFRLAAGLRHALRHTDPETGFTHHGFLNVLVACTVASEGGEVTEVAESLAATHPVPLIEPARAWRQAERPLWHGFGSSTVASPLAELVRLGLINGGFE